MATATIQHSGHTWEFAQLGDDSYSVVCTDPDMSADGVDSTTWPKDETVSEWFGRRVRFADAGDSPRGVESIYRGDTAEIKI